MTDLTSLARMFVRRGYEWNFNDGRRVPKQKEIEEFVLRAVERLSDQPDLSQLEFGRLIVQKHGDFYDVYVQVAELEQ